MSFVMLYSRVKDYLTLFTVAVMVCTIVYIMGIFELSRYLSHQIDKGFRPGVIIPRQEVQVKAS